MKPENKHKSILFITPNISENSIGRTYCLWLIARKLGYFCEIVSFEGDVIWKPLADTEFAMNCIKLKANGERQRSVMFSNKASGFDIIVAVKPLPSSLGIALKSRKLKSFRLVVDVDDPDLDYRLNHGPLWRRIAWRIRHFTFWREACIGNTLGNPDGIFVSNPVLEQTYGGELLPHVRSDTGAGTPHVTTNPSIAFVGTLRSHKGVEFLRDAVDKLASLGFTLTVTDDPPFDAKPHEKWIGRTTLAAGIDVVRDSDIVVIPSEPVPSAVGQLPAKLVDAMMLGRAIVVTDVSPLPWAVGSQAPLVKSGDIEALVLELKKLSDPSTRAALGTVMRQRALSMFSINANADMFNKVVLGEHYNK